MVSRRTYKTSPRTDSKREGSALTRAKKEIKKAKSDNKSTATALNRIERELKTAGKYNKAERKGMRR